LKAQANAIEQAVEKLIALTEPNLQPGLNLLNASRDFRYCSLLLNMAKRGSSGMFSD
jgi:hypothetical protein